MSWAATILIAIILWVPFCAPDIGFVMDYWGAMAGREMATGPVAGNRWGSIWLAAAGCLALLLLHWAERQLFARRSARVLVALDGIVLRAAMITVSVWLVVLPQADDNPFIYFRF